LQKCSGVNWNLPGITPTTVYGSLSIVIVRPMMFGSPPYRLCHKPSARIATWPVPGWFSSAVKVRPKRGFTPSVPKKFQLTRAPSTNVGSPFPVRLNAHEAQAVVCSNDVFCF
jgi:hypothetical protein